MISARRQRFGWVYASAPRFGCWMSGSPEASRLPGRWESGASRGLYRTGDTRIGREPVSSQFP
eukprot:2416135-Prymnesium_polylepis.1